MTKVDGMMFLAYDLPGAHVDFVNNDGDGILQTCGQKMRSACATCILDAEELKIKECSVADLKVCNVPDAYTAKGIDTYAYYWQHRYIGGLEFHDIDGYWDDNGITEYPTLDPTKADTDGDGVSDGDEIRDTSGDWPDVIPASNYNPDEATNPLDPSDFNPDEVHTN